ncbi:peptidoglycan-binding protein [Lacticaseibacillus rhamnosus]|uniref:peptidoglycan-binding protein n=1 Tax=Lacticaseibacillus rhamnosus TaxID=47715 RepID=UPI0008A3AA72|nr:peptidoglycan-binding protein [Lacticaseibacillus rhamnosus]OFN13286.1 peptidoglycan-binding protein [Lactobacillus sp. HMSC072E07]MBS4971712.1 peptidoglycan-binding protein [Lacticaseibacillus rhamnosus]MDK7182033.1 peptidoglycan-binding protein [Lacticaseibacillus rhamnosus]MDK7239492.1 peptidoglycan-binding protein [Lacticaseibacillus rhamnosus]MDT8865674.1 peptidoglycan-binding protein [Lacticaseibacillus rhamnosus]
MKKVAIIGATLLLSVGLVACSGGSGSSSSKSSSSTSQTSNAKVKIKTGADANAKVPAAGTLVMRQLYAAPHGKQSFAAVNVTLNGDTIVSARINEFQYVKKSSDWTGVPNSNKDFGKNYPSGQILIAKAENSKPYSALMKKEAKATHTWEENETAITNFVKGKKISDLKAAVADVKGTKKVSDVVSGATFADTAGYLQAIYDAATTGMVAEGIQTTDPNLTEGQVLAAPHGTQSFGIVTVAMQGDKIANVFLDEFQYMPAKDFGAVPNSNTDFGKGIKAGTVLASKRANSDAYSAIMKSKGKATKSWQENSTAIDEFAKGKTIAELENAVNDLKGKKKASDVVSGATFTDTAGYLAAIIKAAKAAK